jgi:hypothetical protein
VAVVAAVATTTEATETMPIITMKTTLATAARVMIKG